MAEDGIVKFCARVGPRSVCLVMTDFSPDGRGQDHATSSQIRVTVNISKTMQAKDILIMEN